MFGKKDKFSISEVIRGLQHAADSTRQTAIHNHLELLDKFFDVDTNGTYNAKVVKVVLDEDGSYLLIPLIAMIPPKSLYLDNLKVSLSVGASGKVVFQELKSIQGMDTSRTSFDVSLSTGSGPNSVDLELNFKSHDLPESIMKILDQFTNKIQPLSGDTDGTGLNIVNNIK